jgi:hypothetical protein
MEENVDWFRNLNGTTQEFRMHLARLSYRVLQKIAEEEGTNVRERLRELFPFDFPALEDSLQGGDIDDAQVTVFYAYGQAFVVTFLTGFYFFLPATYRNQL